MNKIEFFVMALVGLYLCSCGNRQIGKANSFSNTQNLWSSLVFRLALKLLDINDEPLMGAFADKSALIERLHLAPAVSLWGGKYWPNAGINIGQMGE